MNIKTKVDQATIQRMTKLMKHRGPDDEGLLIDGGLGLGHVRLSIIDLSEKGHQPMANDNELLWIIYNGEIYNCIDIKKAILKGNSKVEGTTSPEFLIPMSQIIKSIKMKKYSDVPFKFLDVVKAFF